MDTNLLLLGLYWLICDDQKEREKKHRQDQIAWEREYFKKYPEEKYYVPEEPVEEKQTPTKLESETTVMESTRKVTFSGIAKDIAILIIQSAIVSGTIFFGLLYFLRTFQ